MIRINIIKYRYNTCLVLKLVLQLPCRTEIKATELCAFNFMPDHKGLSILVLVLCRLWSQRTKKRTHHLDPCIVHVAELTVVDTWQPCQTYKRRPPLMFLFELGDHWGIEEYRRYFTSQILQLGMLQKSLIFPFLPPFAWSVHGCRTLAGLFKQTARMSVLPPPLEGLLDQHVEHVALTTCFESREGSSEACECFGMLKWRKSSTKHHNFMNFGQWLRIY